MYNLARFGFTDMMSARASIRTLLAEPSQSISAAGERVVRFFYEQLADDEGRPACALVRMFKTHPFARLDPELQRFARGIDPNSGSDPNLRCLVLVSTAGEQPEWNDPRRSAGHRAIPLSSVEVVEKAPMISQLIKQFGVSITNVLQPSRELLLDSAHANFNVFYIPVAAGSPYIVAQEEFVKPYGIKSVIGMGGMMASGDLFATILFSRVPITREGAESFKVLGLNLKLGFLPLADRPLFPASSQG